MTRESGSTPIRIWALLGTRAGDNDQVIALAEAIGLPFATKQLEYNGLARFGPKLIGRSLISLTKASRNLVLGEPPPDVTISVGHRSVPAVRVLRERSKGRTRSIHLGFPRVSPGAFDLVVTTPQYPVPDHPNLLRVPFAITRRANGIQVPPDDRLGAMPSPRRLLVVGGPTNFWEIDEAALHDRLEALIEETRREGGAVIVTTSPRTPAGVRQKLSSALAGSGVPSLLAGPGERPNYTSLLSTADVIHVTADSVAMVSDAIWTGRPVALVPIAKSAAGRIAIEVNDRVRRGRRLYPRDLRFFWRALAEIGVGETPSVPKSSAARWRTAILDRARAAIGRA